MPYAYGFNWDKNPQVVERLKELKSMGFLNREIARMLSAEFKQNITISMIINKAYRLGSVRDNWGNSNQGLKVYKSITLPLDNYMLSCDFHAPYHNDEYVNVFFEIARKFNVKKHICAGDLFDFDFIKSHAPIEGEEMSDLDKELSGAEPLLKKLTDQFEVNYLIHGNHERRIFYQSQTKFQAKHVYKMVDQEAHDKFRWIPYDKIFIGEKWIVVHPKNYSQISGNVAIRLAEKYHRHVINAHGHFVALRYDRSGKFMGIDLGGFFDVSKIAYKQLITTTHPEWNWGFGMLLNNHFYHFHEGTDFKYWLKK